MTRSAETDPSTTPPTLIIPGFAGSFDGHWQRIWSEERPGARMVDQDDWFFPRLESWTARLDETLLALPDDEPGAYLVAHSLGCVLAAHVAQGPARHKILGALFVAPCDLASTEQLHPGLIRFAEPPRDALPFPSIVVGSRNDVYMPFDRLTQLAHDWGSELVDIGHAGHINLASGFGRFERGYREFDRLTATISARRRGYAAA